MTDFDMLRKDLILLSPEEFYVKHILKSHNWYFSEYLKIPKDQLIDKMDAFKEIISKKFGISFHNVQIVGSAKVGYSLSPSKLFVPFQPDQSDIDIAIVSEKLYSHFWESFRKLQGRFAVYNTNHYIYIAKSIYRGFINEKDLKCFPEIKKDWISKSSPANLILQDKMNFEQEITYRIYRSWDDLEEYQLSSITTARKRILEGEYNA